MNWLSWIKLISWIVIIVWLIGLGVFVLVYKFKQKRKARNEIEKAERDITEYAEDKKGQDK